MRSLFLFLLIGAALLAALGLAARALEDDSHYREVKAAFAAIDGSEAVSLGGSVARDIRFDPMCLDGAEFAWSGQDLFEIEELGELILGHEAPPRYWFLGLAPTAQMYDSGSRASTRPLRRQTSYRLLRAEGDYSLIGGDWRGAVESALFPAVGYAHWRRLLTRLPEKLGMAGQEKSGSEGNDADLIRMDRLDIDAWAEASETSAERRKLIDRTVYYDPRVAERSEAALRRLNADIRAAGGTLFIVVPPMTRDTRIQTESQFAAEYRGFRAMLRRMEEEGAIVAWYWRAKPYEERPDLFRDNRHLNRAGAERFSAELAADLRARGELPAPSCAEAR